MKIEIEIGPVRVAAAGLDVTRKQLLDMIGEVAGVALALGNEPAESDRPPIGFTAHLERMSDELAELPALDPEDD